MMLEVEFTGHCSRPPEVAKTSLKPKITYVVSISSHHIETTDAGLDDLCIREISVYHTNL